MKSFKNPSFQDRAGQAAASVLIMLEPHVKPGITSGRLEAAKSPPVHSHLAGFDPLRSNFSELLYRATE